MTDIRDSVALLGDALAFLDDRLILLERRIAALEVKPTPAPPPILKPSGSVATTMPGQVIEGLDITGNVTAAHGGAIIRNCRIRHPGGHGIFAQSIVLGLIVHDVEIVNTAATTGLKPNLAEQNNIHLNAVSGTVTIERVTLRGGSSGIYAVNCPAKMMLRFIEGHNFRGPMPRGQLFQANKSGAIGSVLEDFSCVNDLKNSWPEDLVNIWTCPNAWTIRRGLVDGCNSPSGVGVIVEDTPGCIVEDVDAVRFLNGAFSSADPLSKGNTFRRCRARDQVLDQGRGKASSDTVAGPLTFHSYKASGTRYEQVQYWNVNERNLAWDQAQMAVRDFAKVDFVPRATISNVRFGN